MALPPTKVTCPNCGVEEFRHDLQEGRNVFLCDPEHAEGCDEYFVILARVRVDVEVFRIVPTSSEEVSYPPCSFCGGHCKGDDDCLRIAERDQRS